MMTPTKSPLSSRPRICEMAKVTENSDPNLTCQSPLQKPASSPVVGSVKSKKSVAKNPTRIRSLQNNVQERKFVVAKKNKKREAPATVTCNCKDKGDNLKKCPCIAYESLRASQEEFFRTRADEREMDSDESKNDGSNSNKDGEDSQKSKTVEGSEREEEGIEGFGKEGEGGETSEGKDNEDEGFGLSDTEPEIPDPEEIEFSGEAGSSKVKRMRNRMLKEARCSIPKPGSGRVMHLVKAFESILSIPNPNSAKGKEDNEAEERRKVAKWALPGLQPKAAETEVSFLSGDFFFASKNSDRDSGDSRVYSSIDSSTGSIGSRTSGRGRRSRRNSSESTGRGFGKKWEKQLKVTSQNPFKLRTEQRGRSKKEEFQKKVEEMIIEDRKQRIPVAQGLPWTTDEPECLVKPPVKENTKPIDLVLHSDVRAVERAEFDNHVAEKLTLMEQYRLERDKQQKLEEEEEIKRLRRELVPKAQPMPYFDRPFIPKRSLKHPTIPKEPKFQVPHHKKIKCMSWNDINSLYHQH